jgi:hypothetical protein
MSSTDIVTLEPGKFLALNNPEFVEANLADGEEVDEFSLPRVKIPSGGGTTWEIPTLQGIEPARDLTGIVVHFKLTRAYWPDRNVSGTPPQCRSNDARIGVGNPGGQCKLCPLSQFGSAVGEDGQPTDGQACSQKEIWFLLREGSFLPLVLALPATSLRSAKDYRFGQLGSAGVRLSSVVTTLTLQGGQTDSRGNKYSVAVPKLGAMLDPAEATSALEYADAMRGTFDKAAEAVNTEEA